jgi:hypothetical protein
MVNIEQGEVVSAGQSEEAIALGDAVMAVFVCKYKGEYVVEVIGNSQKMVKYPAAVPYKSKAERCDDKPKEGKIVPFTFDTFPKGEGWVRRLNPAYPPPQLVTKVNNIGAVVGNVMCSFKIMASPVFEISTDGRRTWRPGYESLITPSEPSWHDVVDMVTKAANFVELRQASKELAELCRSEISK